jgi:hypothetical protein
MNSVRWLLSVVEVLGNEYWFKTVLRTATRFRPKLSETSIKYFSKVKTLPLHGWSIQNSEF